MTYNDNSPSLQGDDSIATSYAMRKLDVFMMHGGLMLMRSLLDIDIGSGIASSRRISCTTHGSDK